MAKGKKTGGRNFVKGSSGNLKGRKPLSEEAKQYQRLTREEFIKRVNNYLHMSKEQIRQGIANEKTEVLDLFIRNSLIKGIEKGDYYMLDKMLERIIGKVTVNMDLTGNLEANVNNKSTITIDDKALEALGNAIARATTEN